MSKCKKRILVTSQAEDIRTILSTMLSQYGYATIQSSDNKKALDLLALEQFDLVVLDLAEPSETGDAFLQGIGEELLKKLFVVVLTNAIPLKVAERREKYETVFYVSKPFVNDIIRKLVRFLLEALTKEEEERIIAELRSYTP